MGARPGGEAAVPSVIDVSEGDWSTWAALPSEDRVQVGGYHVWTGPFDPPVIVAQPNRWGVVESAFPAEECVVEVDVAVSGWLPMPERVVGYVDRSHRPVAAPAALPAGKALMERARRLSKMLTQTRGVVVAASPFARTIPLLTPLGAADLTERCATRGVVGLRPLEGMAGAVAVTVHSEHRPEDLSAVADVISEIVLGD